MAAARTPRLARPPAGTRVSGGALRPRRAAVRADAGAAAAAEQSSSANGAPSSAQSAEEERNRAAPAGAVADGVTLSDGYAPSCEVEDYIVDPVLNLSISEEDLGADAVAGMLSGLVTPSWRVMLLSDGSVTRHLKLLTEETVHVELVQQRCVGDDQVNLKVLGNDVNTIPGPHVQREVFLTSDTGERMAYAASWWSEDSMNKYMKQSDKPIWDNLASTRTEVYRNILAVYMGHSEELEKAFGCRGPFWGRHYIFWHDGQPMTLIYEVFNPKLNKYLGPSNQNELAEK